MPNVASKYSLESYGRDLQDSHVCVFYILLHRSDFNISARLVFFLLTGFLFFKTNEIHQLMSFSSIFILNLDEISKNRNFAKHFDKMERLIKLYRVVLTSHA